MTDELAARLKQAVNHVMSAEERRAQQISFVYGSVPFNSSLTREDVERRLVEMGLIAPGDGPRMGE